MNPHQNQFQNAPIISPMANDNERSMCLSPVLKEDIQLATLCKDSSMFQDPLVNAADMVPDNLSADASIEPLSRKASQQKLMLPPQKFARQTNTKILAPPHINIPKCIALSSLGTAFGFKPQVKEQDAKLISVTSDHCMSENLPNLRQNQSEKLDDEAAKNFQEEQKQLEKLMKVQSNPEQQAAETPLVNTDELVKQAIEKLSVRRSFKMARK